MPIYLNQYVGFTWDKIGIIFTIVLLPYMLFEFPLGKLADRWLGEKEFLIIGFVIMAGATGALTFITSTSIVVWTIALFMTRVGGSFTEIMSETYFFKQIDDGDVNIISKALQEKAAFAAEKSGHYSIFSHMPYSDAFFVSAMLSGVNYGELSEFSEKFKSVVLTDSIYVSCDFAKISVFLEKQKGFVGMGKPELQGNGR